MSKSTKKSFKPLRPLVDPLKLKAIIDAISQYDLAESQDWGDLEGLSSRTDIDGIEAVPEGIFETDEGFSAAATVYVNLQYGGGDDGIATTDSFPAQAEGHFERTDDRITAVIDSFSVDISSWDC
jgi:hypothetical protein